MDVNTPPPDPRLAEDFAARADDLFEDAFLEPAGVVHVAAAWRAPDGQLPVLASTSGTPRSQTDAFVLELSRARADAIVTTGKILRDEPQLRFELSYEASSWRALILGRPAPPTRLILTTGREPIVSHGSFGEAGKSFLYTTTAGAARLDATHSEHGPQIVAAERVDVRSAIAFLRSEFDAQSISIEAGPSTSAALYASPIEVDELLLTIFEEPKLAEAYQVGALRPLAELHKLLPISSPVREFTEASGRWSFRRLRRSIV